MWLVLAETYSWIRECDIVLAETYRWIRECEIVLAETYRWIRECDIVLAETYRWIRECDIVLAETYRWIRECDIVLAETYRWIRECDIVLAETYRCLSQWISHITCWSIGFVKYVLKCTLNINKRKGNINVPRQNSILSTWFYKYMCVNENNRTYNQVDTRQLLLNSVKCVSHCMS